MHRGALNVMKIVTVNAGKAEFLGLSLLVLRTLRRFQFAQTHLKKNYFTSTTSLALADQMMYGYVRYWSVKR
jgi:hypothetical protein